MRQLQRIALFGALLSATVLSACVVVRDYEGPLTMDVAYIDALSVNGGQFMAFVYDEPQTCKSRRHLRASASWQLPPTEPGSTRQFERIDTNKTVSIAFYLTYPGSTLLAAKFCVPIVNFTPVPGRYYRVALSRGDDACFGSLFSSGDASFTNATREGFRKMVWHNGFDENSSFCDPGDQISP